MFDHVKFGVSDYAASKAFFLAALAPLGARAQVAGSIDEVVQQVLAAVRPGDHLLCMSNGGFGGVHGRLLAALRAKFSS